MYRKGRGNKTRQRKDVNGGLQLGIGLCACLRVIFILLVPPQAAFILLWKQHFSDCCPSFGAFGLGGALPLAIRITPPDSLAASRCLLKKSISAVPHIEKKADGYFTCLLYIDFFFAVLGEASA